MRSLDPGHGTRWTDLSGLPPQPRSRRFEFCLWSPDADAAACARSTSNVADEENPGGDLFGVRPYGEALKKAMGGVGALLSAIWRQSARAGGEAE